MKNAFISREVHENFKFIMVQNEKMTEVSFSILEQLISVSRRWREAGYNLHSWCNVQFDRL